MIKFLVTGTLTQHVSVEVWADDEQDAIGIADAMPYHTVDVWDTTKLWDDVEVIEDDY